VRFWDTSALVAVAVDEPRSVVARELLAEDAEMTVWWATEVECVCAVSRIERDGSVSAAQAADAVRRLDDLAAGWLEIDPSSAIRRTARRLVVVHPLSSADALQLSAAIAAAEDERGSLGFVSFDPRLCRAAALEGFAVLPDQQQV
jgi:predicted nucleic acid-binding protein